MRNMRNRCTRKCVVKLKRAVSHASVVKPPVDLASDKGQAMQLTHIAPLAKPGDMLMAMGDNGAHLDRQ